MLYKKAFLEISQNSQKNTSARVSFLIKLQVCQSLFYRPQAKFRRTPSFTEQLRWLLLRIDLHFYLFTLYKKILQIWSHLLKKSIIGNFILLYSFTVWIRICTFKVSNRNTRARCEICSELTTKTPEWRQLSSLSLTLNIFHIFL